DLLLGIAEGQWLLAMETPSSEKDSWAARAREEFERLNRNRPSGELPPPQTHRLCEWDPTNTEDEIIAAFEGCLNAHGCEAYA
ncbi:MAG: hypothetical protein KDA37_15235, partial [Planctomycetales bacterium]|nr:hypothetical protein [Planctomycetales bacterium]